MKIACIVFVTGMLLSTPDAVANPLEIKSGTSESEVIRQLGQPKGSMSMGDRKILTYTDCSIEIKDGKVVRDTYSVRTARASESATESGEEAIPLLSADRPAGQPKPDLVKLMRIISTQTGVPQGEAIRELDGEWAAPAIHLLVPLLGETTRFELARWEMGRKKTMRILTLGEIAANALARIGMQSWGPCMGQLRNGSPHARANAAQALLQLHKKHNPEDTTFPALLMQTFMSPVMNNSKEAIRERCRLATSLAQIMSPAALETLHRSLPHPDNEFTRHLARILGERNDPASIPVLAKILLSHSDAKCRETTAEALQRYKSSEAAQSVLSGSGAPDPVTRRDVAQILGNADDPAFIPALTRMMQDSDQDVRRAALRGLGNMKNPAGLIPLIEVVAKDPSEYNTSDACSYLHQAVQKNHDPELIRSLLKQINHQDAKRRVMLTDLLGRTGAADGYAALAHVALNDKVPEVRRTAVMFLDNFDNPDRMEVLLDRLYHDPDETVRQAAMQHVKYGSLRDRQQEILLDMMRTLPMDRKIEAAFVLDEMRAVQRNPEALSFFLQCLAHPDQPIRERAASALCREGGVDRYSARGRELGLDHTKWKSFWSEQVISLP